MGASGVDRYGLPLTTALPIAAERYIVGIDSALAHNVGAQASLEAALAADPNFAMAHIALARLFQYDGNLQAARASKEQALACLTGVTRRERQHVLAMATAIDGDGPGALALIREHMQDFPRDAFLLKQADGPFGLIGFGGSPQRLEENFALLKSVAQAYGDDWWFLSAYAFAHNELGYFQEASDLAERAMERNPNSGHSAHTMAHVFFETGDAAGGAAFLDEWLVEYPPKAQIYSHLTWHLALFNLAAGYPERVLALYHETLRPQVCSGAPLIALCDAAALMWRLDLYGVERPATSRQDMAAFAAQAFPRAGITFGDTHCALAYAAAGEYAALEQLAGEVHKRLEQGKVPAGEVAPALIAAVAAFAREEYTTTIATLEPLLDHVVRIGGSNAQRQVFEDTLLQAYLRAERYTQAATLLRQRLARRPSTRDAQWLQQAQTVYKAV